MSAGRGDLERNVETWRVGDSQSTKSCGSPKEPCKLVLYEAIWTSKRSGVTMSVCSTISRNFKCEGYVEII